MSQVSRQSDTSLLSEDEVLLKIILNNHNQVKAPWKTIRAPGQYQFFIGLGRDEVAEITISAEGLKRLGIDRTEPIKSDPQIGPYDV